MSGMWVFFPEGPDNIVGGLRRASITRTDDSGEQQLVDIEGLASEKMTKIVRSFPHGFSSHAPAEALAHLLSLGGRADRAMLIGGEHKQYRPRNLAEGETALYNSSGILLRLLKDKLDLDAGGHDVVVRNAAKITATATTRAALGAGNLFINVKPGRVNLGVSDPDADAGPKVMTDAGASSKVFAEI